jgi:hypothetical protein
MFQDSAEVCTPYFLWVKVHHNRKEFLLFVTSVFSPPLMTFHTQKDNIEHNIIYLKKHIEKFCGKTGIQSRY